MANIIKTSLWAKTGFNKLEKYLDLAAYRHKLISGNVSNVSTPGYTAKDIDFNKEINNALGNGPVLAMKTTSTGHLGNSGPERQIKVIETRAQSEDDLNGVDIDKEVTNMSINQMRFTIGAQILKRKVNFLQKAIKGR
ncbi:MAG: flagellar basal body rod protein FlgB [candidate division Zixibacteria bacterium]|nr:flagellar basal body rod protein FlgB [candidate division Zixibacteria bacterium]